LKQLDKVENISNKNLRINKTVTTNNNVNKNMTSNNILNQKPQINGTDIYAH
jgi:hypothetical protein